MPKNARRNSSKHTRHSETRRNDTNTTWLFTFVFVNKHRNVQITMQFPVHQERSSDRAFPLLCSRPTRFVCCSELAWERRQPRPQRPSEGRSVWMPSTGTPLHAGEPLDGDKQGLSVRSPYVSVCSTVDFLSMKNSIQNRLLLLLLQKTTV